MPDAIDERRFDVLDAMKRLGKTQQEVATAAGVSRVTVTKVLAGERYAASDETRLKIFRAFVDAGVPAKFFPELKKAKAAVA